MNLNNVFLFVKTGVTNVTFEWFLSIVNWSNVFSRTALVRRAVITSSHLNVLFSSWTGSMCIFKLPFWEKQWSQMSHLSGFFTSWISELCFLKFFWREIFWLHKGIQIFSSFHDHQQYVSLNCSLQKNLVTNITLEQFVRIVDRSSVFWQIAFLRKTLVTNVTFERFLSLFMYFRNMFFHSLFLRAVKEQINLWIDL